MKEYPILFSSEMVNAILDGRKTQTRRALTKQPIDALPMKVPNLWVTLETRNPHHGRVIRCRYGVPGDRLWVRETWQTESRFDIFSPSEVPQGSNLRWLADDSIGVASIGCPFGRVRPSIHMPRWASRIVLEIMNIRLERLQEITGDECTLEGIQVAWSDPNNNNQEIETYKALWDKLNSKRGFGWDVNPWVWVIEFKAVKS